jgi:uncharacterized DUF497 family protein
MISMPLASCASTLSVWSTAECPFVTYTMRGEIVRITSARGAEPHEKRKYQEI